MPHRGGSSLSRLFRDKLREHSFERNLAVVGSLDLGMDSIERAAQGVFGRSTKHFALKMGISHPNYIMGGRLLP